MSFRKTLKLLYDKEDNKKIKKFIKCGNLFNVRSGTTGDTLLHYAVECDNYEILQFLVEMGSEVAITNKVGQTALVKAIESEYPCKKMIRCLLKATETTFLGDSYWQPALAIIDCSSWLGEDTERFEIYKIFLEYAYFFDNFQLLKTGDEKSIEMLLQTGIDLDKEGYYDRNSLIHMLAINKNPGVIALLHNKKIDVNTFNDTLSTPLMLAASNGVDIAVEFLLDKEANINLHDYFGKSALYYACERESDEEGKKCIQLLLEHGADAQFVNYKENSTILNLVLKNNYFEVGQLILANLALLEANGTVLSQLICSQISSDERFKAYFEYCKVQLSMHIYQSVTLFDTLIASERKFEGYASNKAFASKILNFQISNYYNKLLSNRILKVEPMIKFRKSVAPIICKLMRISYVNYPFVADVIVGYLEKNDLKCLKRKVFVKD